MGNCCNSQPKENEEMKDGIFPKIDNTEEEDEKNEKKEEEKENQNEYVKETENVNEKDKKKSLYNFSQNYYQQDSMDSEFVTSEQKISEEMFNYFNDIRLNPQNYLSEGQKNGLQNIISTAAEKAVENTVQNLIRNPFYEMFFDNCVKSSPNSKDDILKSFEKEEKLKNHEKELYMILGEGKKPKECVWSLIKNSENNGEILWKDIDYLLISIMFLEETKNFLCYFLFLYKSTNANE